MLFGDKSRLAKLTAGRDHGDASSKRALRGNGAIDFNGQV
jgi:hypothetical protein